MVLNSLPSWNSQHPPCRYLPAGLETVRLRHLRLYQLVKPVLDWNVLPLPSGEILTGLSLQCTHLMIGTYKSNCTGLAWLHIHHNCSDCAGKDSVKNKNIQTSIVWFRSPPIVWFKQLEHTWHTVASNKPAFYWKENKQDKCSWIVVDAFWKSFFFSVICRLMGYREKRMPFSRRFYPKRLTVMCAYILPIVSPDRGLVSYCRSWSRGPEGVHILALARGLHPWFHLSTHHQTVD
jgi:hypothetical protein